MSGRPLNQYVVEGRVYWSITLEQIHVLKVKCARSCGQEGWRCKRRHTPDAQATISDRHIIIIIIIIIIITNINIVNIKPLGLNNEQRNEQE